MSTQAETNFDPFEDENETDQGGDDSAKADDKATDDKAEDKAAEGDDKSTDDNEEASATSAGEEGTEGTEALAKAEKMIPESRLKAAVTSVQAKLEEANRELEGYRAKNVPDKDTDPEGYNLHIRMEASKAVMREMKPDYDEKIAHYQEMAKLNPLLNQAVADHPIPAKLAYDIAAKDMELKELAALKESPEYKEFQEFKKQKAKAPTDAQDKVSKQVTNGLGKVPNLNRATDTSVKKSSKKDQEEAEADDLFKDSVL